DSKRVREAAQMLLAKAGGAARPLLENLARDGKRAEREQAVRLLGNLCGEGARAFLEERLTAETSAHVKEQIEKMLGMSKPVQCLTGEPQEAPPHVPLPADSAVTPGLRACLERMFKEFNEHAARHNDPVAKNTSKMYIHPPGNLDFLKEKELDEAC